jgi:hypothetical protein
MATQNNSQLIIDNQQVVPTDRVNIVASATNDGRPVTTQNPLPVSVSNLTNISIAAGLLEGYTTVHKYGSVDGTNGTGWNTVWTGAETDGQQLYPWPAIGAASVVTVVSSSGSDVTAVTLQGLDSNYDFQEETITLTGVVPATGTKTWHRVNRAFMTGTATNVGKIIVKNATPTVVTEIKAGRGQTLQSLYTVPAGCTGFLSTIQMTSNKAQDAEVAMFARPFGGAFRVVGGTFLYRSDHTIEYSIPIKFTEKTDIDVRIIGTNNNSVSCSFDLLIVSNAVLNS